MIPAILVLALGAAGVPQGGAWKPQPAVAFFAKLVGCEGKIPPPWGQGRPAWNSYMKAFGFRPEKSLPWKERGKNLGRRWIYLDNLGHPLEVMEGGGLGLGLVLSLGFWRGDDAGAPNPEPLIKTLQGFCPPLGKTGCPEGGTAWLIPDLALALMFRPPEEAEEAVEAALPSATMAPHAAAEDLGDEWILAAFAGGDVSPCGEEENQNRK